MHLQTVELLGHPVGTLVANHIEPADVLQAKLTGTLVQNLVKKSGRFENLAGVRYFCINGIRVGFVAEDTLLQTTEADTGADDVNHLTSLLNVGR